MPSSFLWMESDLHSLLHTYYLYTVIINLFVVYCRCSYVIVHTSDYGRNVLFDWVSARRKSAEYNVEVVQRSLWLCASNGRFGERLQRCAGRRCARGPLAIGRAHVAWSPHHGNAPHSPRATQYSANTAPWWCQPHQLVLKLTFLL